MSPIKTLVIVHLEPDFKQHISESLVSKVTRYAKLFDRVIVVESASQLTGTQPFDEIESLKYTQYNVTEETWIWGAGCCDENDTDEVLEKGLGHYGIDWIRCETSRHPIAVIERWMQKLPRDHQYYMVGGYRSECLASVHDIFVNLGLNVRVVESLTYGQ